VNTEAFLLELPGLWDGDPQTADHPRDRRFQRVIEATRGMATENKLALLNLAAQHLSDGQVYVEVGAWAGCSIIGASLGNRSRQFVTIDDFSEFGGPLVECQRNLEQFNAVNVELINGSAWDVLRSTRLPGPVGVYFYDGGHSFVDQYRAFEYIEPLLADEALVIIDDTAGPAVADANRLYTRTRPQFERVVVMTSQWSGEPRWWNGIEVYAFRRERGPGLPPSRFAVWSARAREVARRMSAWSTLQVRRVQVRLRRLSARRSRS